jgi:hypothetical protein
MHRQRLMMRDKIDPTGELADFAADAAWREVEDFIRNEKANPPRTAKERKARKARLVEILNRYYCRAVEIYAQAESGGFSTEKN